MPRCRTRFPAVYGPSNNSKCVFLVYFVIENLKFCFIVLSEKKKFDIYIYAPNEGLHAQRVQRNKIKLQLENWKSETSLDFRGDPDDRWVSGDWLVPQFTPMPRLTHLVLVDIHRPIQHALTTIPVQTFKLIQFVYESECHSSGCIEAATL